MLTQGEFSVWTDIFRNLIERLHKTKNNTQQHRSYNYSLSLISKDNEAF